MTRLMAAHRRSGAAAVKSRQQFEHFLLLAARSDARSYRGGVRRMAPPHAMGRRSGLHAHGHSQHSADQPDLVGWPRSAWSSQPHSEEDVLRTVRLARSGRPGVRW